MKKEDKKEETKAAKAVKSSRAVILLGTSASVKQRSQEYAVSISRNLKRTIIDGLQAKIDDINDKMFELQDFTLETNLNSGKSALTREQCERRFESIINFEYEKELLTRELRIKSESYDGLFS